MNTNKLHRPKANPDFSKGKWLRCNKKKEPIDKWRHVKRPCSKAQLGTHVVSFGNVGVVPGSLDLIVFDIDTSSCGKHDLTPREALDELMLDYQRPLFWYKTPSGGIHAGYPYKGRRHSGQLKWKYGDLISGNGCYFVVWNLRKFSKRYSNALTITDNSIDQLIGKPKTTPKNRWEKGNRNNTLNDLTFQAVLSGRPGLIKQYSDDALNAGLSKRAIKATIKSAQKGARKENRQRAKRPVFQSDLEAFAMLLDYAGVEFRYNVRTFCPEWRLFDNAKWIQLNDRSEGHIREMLAISATMPKGKGVSAWRLPDTRWVSLMNSYLFSREHDPIREWMDELPRKESPLLRTWLHELFQFDSPKELVRETARLIVGGIIQRTFDPGSEIRQSALLVGPPKAGKTQLTRSLLPRNLSASGVVNFHDNDRRRLESITGKAVVELAELQGLTAARVENIKHWLTLDQDSGTRRAYARRTEHEPRRCVFVGTANFGAAELPSDRALIDRFSGLYIRKERGRPGHVKRWLTKHRKELFGAALHDYEKGSRYMTLPHSLIDQAMHESAKLIVDELQDMKDQIVKLAKSKGKNVNGRLWISTASIKTKLMMVGPDEERNMMKALRQLEGMAHLLHATKNGKRTTKRGWLIDLSAILT